MHVCLLIDLLTLCYLANGLRAGRLGRRLLCLGCLAYLLAVSLHAYFYFAPWFGFFQHHRTLAALTFTTVLDFFGGFWTFFGVMVFVKGVSWIALAFLLFNAYGRFARPPETRLAVLDQDTL